MCQQACHANCVTQYYYISKKARNNQKIKIEPLITEGYFHLVNSCHILLLQNLRFLCWKEIESPLDA